VDGKKLDIASYRVSIGEVISLKDKTSKIPYVAACIANKSVGIPAWLERQATVGKVVALPDRTDITEGINEQLVVEFYSR
jgi:small subunit ribosomal protein S4